MAHVTPVCACVWRGGVTLPGAGLTDDSVSSSSSLSAWGGGRCFSRYVSGDGDHTDVFSSPRSTKCPRELRRETSEHCENEGHSTKKHVWGDYDMGNFSLEVCL